MTVSGPCPQSRTRSRALASRVLSECMTHLGAPVVPDVKAKYVTLSGVSQGGIRFGPGRGNNCGVNTTFIDDTPESTASKFARSRSAPQPLSVSSARQESLSSKMPTSRHV